MTQLPLLLSEADYSRASAFVIGHLRELGATPTSVKPLTVVAVALYMLALFVVQTAPNFQDERTRLIIKLCVAALVAVPILFFIGVKRLRIADARALQPLMPSPGEPLSIAISANQLEVRSEFMTTQLSWSAASLFVLNTDFAVLLAPRMAPLPLTPAACKSQDEFLTFLRVAQQYKANSGA
jgi:hypothetical protein